MKSFVIVMTACILSAVWITALPKASICLDWGWYTVGGVFQAVCYKHK